MVAVTACGGEAPSSTPPDHPGPAPAPLEVALEADPGAAFLGPRGIALRAMTVGPVVEVTLNGWWAEESAVLARQTAAPWRFELTPADLAQAQGAAVSLTARALGADGQLAVSAPWEVTVDLAPPTARGWQPEPESVASPLTSASVLVADEASGLDPFATAVTARFDGGGGFVELMEGTDYTRVPRADGEGIEIVIARPVDGRYELVVEAVDRAGNQAPTSEAGWWSDTSPPEVLLPGAGDALVVYGEAFGIEAEVVDLTGVTRLVARLEDASGGATEGERASGGPVTLDTLELADGAGTLFVIATDGAGLSGDASRAVVIDNLPPEILGIEPADGALHVGLWEVTVMARDAGVGLAGLVATVGDAAPTAAAFDEEGRATLSLEAPSGEHLVELVVTDQLGREARASRTWWVDRDPPEVALGPPSSELPAAALPTLTVVVSDAIAGPDIGATLATLSLERDGEPLAPEVTPQVTVVGPDRAEIAVDGAPSGRYTLTVTPMDTLGNAGEPAAGTWVVDATPPEVELVAPGAGAVIHGTTVIRAALSDDDVVTGAVAVLRDAAGLEVMQQLVSGSWLTAVDTSALAEGPLTLAIVAWDRAGNEGRLEVALIVDNQPPVVTGRLPEDGWLQRSFSVEAQAADLGAGIAWCRVVEPAGVVLAEQAFPVPAAAAGCSLPLAFEADGERVLHLVVGDAAGRVTSEVMTWSLDGTPPTASVTPPSGLVAVWPEVRVEVVDALSGIDPEVIAARVEVLRNGEPAAGWQVTPLGGGAFEVTLGAMVPGAWSVAVAPVDRVGNEGALVEVSYVLDSVAPRMTIDAPEEGAWWGGVGARVLLSPEDDESGVDSVRVVVEDALGAELAVERAAAPWELSLDASTLAPGPARLRATAWDHAGNEAHAEVDVVVDSEAPEVVVFGPDSGVIQSGTLILSGAALDVGAGLARIEVREEALDGPLLAEVLLPDAPGEHALAVEVTPERIGALTLWLVAVDGVGLVGAAPWHGAVDSRPPVVVAVTPLSVPIGADGVVRLRVDDGQEAWASGPDREASLATLAVTRGDAPWSGWQASLDDVGRITVALMDAPSGPIDFALTPVDRVGNAGERRSFRYHVDRDPPRVVAFDPPPGSTTAVARAPIIAHFDEDLDLGSVSAEAMEVRVSGEIVAGGAAPGASPRQVVFHALHPYPPLTEVEVTVLPGVRDRAGNVMTEAASGAFTVRSYHFLDRAADFGLADYRGDTAETGERHGPGGAFVDLDGDGYPDLVLGTGVGEPVHVYLNVPHPSGEGRTFEAFPFDPDRLDGQVGIVAADFDNDGAIDLYVCNYGSPNALYRNLLAETGTLAFVNVTAATRPAGADHTQLGVGVAFWGGRQLKQTMTAAWADVNRDGLLDLYVGSHNGSFPSGDVTPVAGERDTLYLNNGDGTFTDVTEAANVPGWMHADGRFVTPFQQFSSTNAVVFADLNNDRWPDLIVTNKLRHPDDRDMVYLNLGEDEDGQWLGFRPINYDFDEPLGHTNSLAMGVNVADVDNDGDLDVYISDWSPLGASTGGNELWLNQFAETGVVSFVKAPCCDGVYSWGVQMEDLDHDGLVDIHVSSNFGQTDLLYHQGPDGEWPNVASLWGLAQMTNARGTMAADVNRDGWLDLFVVNLLAPSKLYQSYIPWVLEAPRSWLSVLLQGDPDRPGPHRSTRDAIGARLYFWADVDGDGVDERLTREVVSGSSNAASTSSLEVEVGLGQATTVDIEIHWPSGHDTLLVGVPVNRHLLIVEGQDEAIER